MSEITKLYENAGIEPERQDCCKIADKYWAYNTEKGFEYLMQKECPHNQECTDECEYAYDKVIYSPFTAEKQILLLDFLSKYEITIINESNTPYYMIYTHDKVGSVKANNIGELMAKYINMFLWQDLSKEEKQQVKGILE